MPKRTFSQLDPSSPTQPSSSPSKRIHTSTPASRSTASSLFSTPYTPSVYSIPADSPTNPLGLKRRVNNLTLPKATPFSKHIALRFQLKIVGDTPPSKPSLWDAFSPDSSPSANGVYSKNPLAAQYAREGTYRIVQAPLSYTFRHLYALILFLFSGDPAAPRSLPGHLFAGARQAISCSGSVLLVALPCRSHRCRGRAGQDEEDLEDEEEDASWRWEGEDDFTLGHMWDVRARDPKRGIIYYHNDTTAVHITVNAQTVPHRKGVGNMPFVFRAYGPSRLDPRRPRSPSPSPKQRSLPTPAPPRIFPTYKRPVPTNRTTAAAAAVKTRTSQGPGDTDIDDALSSSDEDDFDGGLDTRVWNHTGAFPRFLSIIRASAPSSSSSSSSSSSPSPSPSMPPSPSSSPVRTSLSSSSPTRTRGTGMRRAATMPYGAAGEVGSASASASSAVSLSLPSSYPTRNAQDGTSFSPSSSSPTRSLPSLTPAPARVRTRYRVARAARRLLGLAERGLESAAAEEADLVDGRVQGQGKKGAGKKKDRSRLERKDVSKSKPKTKTMTGDAGEVWNPFVHHI
ncbi:hypothetical protein BC827DRAFT_1268832 [Russula dissimulans]|nr:hypothetical protein BC827DRAFT_1268832 [Russula dissimulans]